VTKSDGSRVIEFPARVRAREWARWSS